MSVLRKITTVFTYIFVLIAVMGAAILGYIYGKKSTTPEIREIEKVKTVIKEVIKEVKVPIKKQTPQINIPRKLDFANTNMGFALTTNLKSKEGELATIERKDPKSYYMALDVKVNIPKPAKTLKELEKSAPNLSKILPGLAQLVENSTVSPYYEALYKKKLSILEKKTSAPGEWLTKHNFYDCQSILNLRKSGTNKRLFLLQGDMDVVSDGSDGDRLPKMPSEIVNSTHYQYSTSYSWPKQSKTPNPLLAGFETRLKNAKAELISSAVDKERKKWVKKRINKLILPGIEEMKRRSFLIAEHDPFIVIPLNIITDRKSLYAPKVGDYSIVIYEGKVYPAIVGDAGPTYKVGEASLRLAKHINPKASAYYRPVSSLNVTYIVFLQSAGPKAPPDLELWHAKCTEHINEIGGLGKGYKLDKWKNTLPELN